jgi:hypothetical protein
MNPEEIRYRVISTLLQADGPLTLRELLAQSGVSEEEIHPVLKELVSKSLVIEGELLADKPVPQYCWEGRRAAQSKQKLKSIVKPPEVVKERALDIDSEPVLAFCDHVINEYKPPADKRFLVFFQCSVRRPFSSSPSHASMRRAISVATGYDPSPRKDFESCPVHAVVLASKIGPVPYELEDVYPANVRGGGVKHFDREYYNRVKPILAERMARYVITHKDSYERITTFTESRYGEVMEEAREIVVDCCGESLYFPVLPVMDGSQILRVGKSMPRTYWEKYWIQLYLEIVSWLEPDIQAQAEARLNSMDVRYSKRLRRNLPQGMFHK